MRARQVLEGSTFGPETMKIITEAFDQAWASIEKHFHGEDEHDLEKVRLRLAHSMLVVAHVDSADVERPKNDALELMALAGRKQPQ